MARYRRTKKYYRTKGRWSANISTLNENITNVTSGSFFKEAELTTNPAQSPNTVSQQYTVKNTSIQFEIDSALGESYIENLTAYIMFIPQGYVVTETLPNTHPEWIMAMRYYGSPGPDTNYYRNPLTIRTRLARRLQTGDKVSLLLVGTKQGSESTDFNFRGVVRWWTKAN